MPDIKPQREMIRVVQFSLTALAGAPIRVAQATRRLPGVEVRMVDMKRNTMYEQDHVHEESPEKTLEFAEQADIIHFYNQVNFETREFAPVNFRALQKRGKAFVQHFQSTPMFIAEKLGVSTEAVVNYPIPKIVIAQYPERFLPEARVVPNIIPQENPAYRPPVEAPNLDVVYTPTWERSAWESRWDTKGLPETAAMLRSLQRHSGARIRVVRGRPLAEVMQAKRDALIVIDELVTGSYHLSSLEGLALAKAVACYLDARTDFVLRTVSGSAQLPFVNVRLEEAREALTELLRQPDELRAIGANSRRWIDAHWRDEVLARHFHEIYRQLLDDPTRVTRQPELRLDAPHQRFFALSLPDAIYNARRKQQLPSFSGRHYYAQAARNKARQWLAPLRGNGHEKPPSPVGNRRQPG